MKKNVLLLCLLSLCLLIHAQEKQVFSESFADNHNKWPTINKKTMKASVSANKYYELSNHSKNQYEEFTVLNTVPLDTTKDLHITMDAKNIRMEDKDYDGTRSRYCWFIIGAKDENSGYFISQDENSLTVGTRSAHGTRLGYYTAEIKISNPERIDMRIEHNRWKFYSWGGNELVNIPAMPLEGTKLGVSVFSPGHYALTNITVSEKEKDIIKTDFPIALFMFAYQHLRCSAKEYFKDDLGEKQSAANTWRSKTGVPGFGFSTNIYIYNKIAELSTGRYFNTKDEAFAYYDEAKAAINLSADSCLDVRNNSALLKDEKLKKYIQFDNWYAGFYGDNLQQFDGNVFLCIIEGKDSGFNLEFHIIVYPRKTN